MYGPVIKCENVYKIFGTNDKKMRQEANGNIDAKTFQEHERNVGVNNSSFEDSKEERIIVMDYTGSGR